MWAYILRRTLYNIPVYLGILLLVMLILRVNDPVYAYLGKNASQKQIDLKREEMGLNESFAKQYFRFVGDVLTLFGREKTDEATGEPTPAVRSWEQQVPVRQMILSSIPPSLLVTIPTLVITTTLAIGIALISASFRGRGPDKTLMFLAVLGMSISYLVYIIIGQYFLAAWPQQALGIRNGFAISGYEPKLNDLSFWTGSPRGAIAAWVTYCGLPVIIGVTVGLGYDARFYRAVMVEETGRDYITTAKAKGASRPKVMFVHMLKNAMIPVITRVMITLPFLIEGSVLVEYFFNIPGMGKTLITAINAKDFPVIQAFTALLAFIFIATNILTDVLYALVDPRVRLQ